MKEFDYTKFTDEELQAEYSKYFEKVVNMMLLSDDEVDAMNAAEKEILRRRNLKNVEEGNE